MQWFITCLKKYAIFSGRSRRAEYWYFQLFASFFGIVLLAIETFALGIDFNYSALMVPFSHQQSITVSDIYYLALVLPAFAVGVRRLHDVDKSGWWALLVFIVIIGWVPLIVWLVKSGTTGLNRFGHDPKQVEHSIEESVDPDPTHPHTDIPESDPK